MLQKNPLDPPRLLGPAATSAARTRISRSATSFVSAEDFDATGILAGVDPCESRYWWLPELVSGGEPAAEHQATSRSRPAARS